MKFDEGKTVNQKCFKFHQLQPGQTFRLKDDDTHGLLMVVSLYFNDGYRKRAIYLDSGRDAGFSENGEVSRTLLIKVNATVTWKDGIDL